MNAFDEAVEAMVQALADRWPPMGLGSDPFEVMDNWRVAARHQLKAAEPIIRKQIEAEAAHKWDEWIDTVVRVEHRQKVIAEIEEVLRNEYNHGLGHIMVKGYQHPADFLVKRFGS